MKNLESEKESIEEKVENNSNREEEVKESSIEPESKPSKKAFFKPRKAKRLPVRITENAQLRLLFRVILDTAYLAVNREETKEKEENHEQ